MSAPIRRALISVSDKTGIEDLARALARHGVEIVSTGGTAQALRAAGIAVEDVSGVTGFPEIMDGRVKTLHPRVHGGLLGRRGNAEHLRAMRENGIAPIDLLVVNLYPFEETAGGGGSFDSVIEMIDVGGPAMIRAAAKNHGDVTVVVSPDDYGAVLAEIEASGATRPDTRRRLAAKAFARTAAYDAAISQWFLKQEPAAAPPVIAFGGRLIQRLRYGENPQQSAGFYASSERRPGVATARQVQGRELSYNNINDSDAAYECVAEFAEPACVIVKHANPCGAAVGASLLEAYDKARRCDPVSAFGGIVALNRPLDAAAAAAIIELFTEVIIAPGAEAEALALIAGRKNLRLLLCDGLPDPRADGLLVKSVAGGLLVQSRDAASAGDLELRVVTRRAPGEGERADLLFAFKVAKHVKSNAIVLAREGATLGIGAGQMSRLDAVRIAVRKAEEAALAAGAAHSLARGAVVASDAFFPFPDGLIAAAEAGASAAIQPGGSLKDEEVIRAADAAGLAMVFTGRRHFRH